MRKTKPNKVSRPGEAPDPENTDGRPAGAPDDDAAIAAGKAGGTHKIAKPKPFVPPSKVKGDPDRPAAAAVNAKQEMPYAEAMKLLEAGKLTRSVLTERGWVVVPRTPPRGPQPTT